MKVRHGLYLILATMFTLIAVAILRTVMQFDGDVFTINDGMEPTDEESSTMYRETRSLDGLGG